QNNLFNIISEVNKGNVLTLSAGTTNPTYVSLVAKKIGLQTLINQRTPGNNVLKLEIDYYTGAQLHGSVTYSQQIVLSYDANNNVFSFNNRLAYFAFWSSTGRLDISSKDHKAPDSLSGSILPFNTWVTFIVYLDYNNKKAYFEVPYLNKIAASDFFKNSTSANLIEDFKPTALGLLYTAQNQTPSLYLVNKYDNIKITALQSVPAYVLNAEDFLAEKFNIYPNPASNVVNITNAENMLVNQVVIYDVAGKLINTQSFKEQAEIQLNVENLASGTYLLHLQTAEGTAVKKLVKK